MKESALRALREALVSRAAAAELHGETCALQPGPWLEIFIADTQLAAMGKGQSATLLVCARNPGTPDILFSAICIGAGADAAQAGDNAARRWVDLAYPALHGAFSGHGPAMGMEGPAMLPGPTREVPWKIHFGAVLETATGTPALSSPPRTTDFLPYLTRPIAALVAGREAPFAMDLFVGKSGEGEVDTDCRIDCEPWEEGNEALVAAADAWSVAPKGYAMRRQYILFV